MTNKKKKVKALVVDDSDLTRKAVMKALRETQLADFVFTEACDGLEALKKFKGADFQILFVDWNMPNMSGIDFVKRVRKSKKNKGVQIVMVTSEKTVGKVEEAVNRAGANAYVFKPFTASDFNRKLTSVVAQVKSSSSWISKMFGG